MISTLKILFIGPQGSGKSTQGKLLSKYLHLPYLSSGDMFRSISKKKNDLGKRVKDILGEGKLVDDQATCEVVKEELKRSIYNRGFILDGYPRTVEQIKSFDPGFDLVFYLDVSKKVSLERLLKRVRDDDTPALIESRLTYYYEQTHPLLKYFKARDIVKEIDGEKSVSEIAEEIREVIEKLEHEIPQ